MSDLFSNMFKPNPSGYGVANVESARGSWVLWYGSTIKWGGASFSVEGFNSREDADRAVIGMAEKSGWTNPRWWQFWRWSDTRFSRHELERLRNKKD